MPTYDSGTSGLTGTIGVTVLHADGTVHAARSIVGITEPVAGSGVYHVADPDPTADLVLVWDEGVGVTGGSETLYAPRAPLDATATQAAVAAEIAAAEAPPAGYTRVTSATYGTLRAGSVIDAYAPADTTYSTPLVDNAVAASNGMWAIDLPDDGTYVLVARLAGYEDVTQAGVMT